MTNQRVLAVLSVGNLLLLAFSLLQSCTVVATGSAPVLRGRGLEIVDDNGRVRASIAILPANPTVKMPDGTTGYPETVLLRLITSEGRPNVKLGAGERGSGLLLGGEEDPTYVQILAEGSNPKLKLSNGSGQEQVLQLP
jgi:hypothetical protein